jgi:hypothetical protein
MPLENPSFEDEGTNPGEAQGWTITASTSLEKIAGFGDPATAYEDFERWYEHVATLDDVDAVRAFFGILDGFEAFERGWDNNLFFTEFELVQLLAASFNPTPNTAQVETFETNWANVPYLTEYPLVSPPLTAGVFSTATAERFEANWKSNETFTTSWSGVTSSAAMFDSGAQAVEDYENAWDRHLGDPFPDS